MLLTITQSHVDKAYKDDGTRTTAQCCPIWQALHEMGLEVSVGWNGDAYTIFRTVSGLPTGDCIARIEKDHPLYDIADWFDSPCARGTVKLDSPITAELEMFT